MIDFFILFLFSYFIILIIRFCQTTTEKISKLEKRMTTKDNDLVEVEEPPLSEKEEADISEIMKGKGKDIQVMDAMIKSLEIQIKFKREILNHMEDLTKIMKETSNEIKDAETQEQIESAKARATTLIQSILISTEVVDE